MKLTSGAIPAVLLAIALCGSVLHAQQTTDSAQTAKDAAIPATDSPAAPVSSAATSVTPTPATDPSATAPSASTDSKIRIVRLSQVEGEVQLDRNVDKGFEKALPNLPIVEGAKLQTTSGFAEVELEDNSTLRVAPDTLVEFPVLELRQTGVKTSTVNVLKGTVYLSLLNNKENEFTLNFQRESIPIPPGSHVRLQVDDKKATLAVLEGNLQLAQPSGSTQVGKKKTVTFDLAGQNQPEIAKNVTEYDFDTWDKQAVDYHKRYANASAFGNSPYAFGVSDLNYYGSFVNAGGCGSMWRPYFVSASWDPYSNGAWAWYSGAGYSWVSPYPWGWTPYHYGSWAFCDGVGWGWQPGGSWMGLGNSTIVLNRPKGPAGGTGPRPVLPPRPVAGRPSLFAVNTRPLAASRLSGQDTFMFSKDSAGFGVPRGSLGKLQDFSRGVERHGAIVTSVYSAPIATGQREIRGANPGLTSPGLTSIRSGPSVGPPASSNIRVISRSPGGLSNPGGIGPRGMGAGGIERGGGSPNMGSHGTGSSSMGGPGSMGGGGMSHGGGAPAGGHR
jgi:Family of unknown function (DUF6600)/FecR protein